MDTSFYENWSYFGPSSRFVKPRLKICTFANLFKVYQNKVEKMHFCWLSRNCVLKVDLGTHLRDKHGHLFWWDLKLFLPMLKVGQTKVENMQFCRLSWSLIFKVDLGTHLGHKYGNLFLWDLELFWPSFKVGQTKIENIYFCWLLGIDFWKLI